MSRACKTLVALEEKPPERRNVRCPIKPAGTCRLSEPTCRGSCNEGQGRLTSPRAIALPRSYWLQWHVLNLFTAVFGDTTLLSWLHPVPYSRLLMPRAWCVDQLVQYIPTDSQTPFSLTLTFNLLPVVSGTAVFRLENGDALPVGSKI